MQKYFNIAGPCNVTDHYMLKAAIRQQQIMPLIDQKQYFVIHAARQSGKTTLLLDLVQKLNTEGNYFALYCSLENVQGITEAEKGIPAIVNVIKLALSNWQLPNSETFAQNANFADYTNVLLKTLTDYCKLLPKPLVLFFDEADCLSNQTLISFLRQLRNGYNTRSQIPFIHSLALVGMRNIRDFKAKIRPDADTLGSASPFNIVTKALTLKNFTEEEIKNLYAQHTAQTNQTFSPEALEMAYQQTNGQPWLVNAIAREVVQEILMSDYSKPITETEIKQAIQNIILRRDTHIDSLLERLKEPRVQEIIEPMLLGESRAFDNLSDNYLYTHDLGLIRSDRGLTEPANPIYAEVIARTLAYSTQEALKADVYPYTLPQYFNGNIIDMNLLLHDFQDFWRENSAIWAEKFDYKEAAPHLILMAFLQRIINGGGQIIREMAAERRRLDLCLVYNNHKYPIELKLYRGEKTYTEGIEQTAKYMQSLNCTQGWLIVFDRRADKSWEQKIFWQTHVVETKTIHVVGC